MIGPYELNSIAHGHALELARRLPDNSIDAIITSPPFYGLRDYLTPPVLWPAVTFAPMAGLPPITIPEQEASLGLEADLWAYVGHLVALFRELRRALKGTGTLWINLGDSYATSGGSREYGSYDGTTGRGAGVGGLRSPGSLPAKNLMGIPWRVAFALQADGWILRSECIWHKPNPMPESVTDRPTKAHEQIFLMSKSERYFYDAEAIREPGQEHGGQAGTFARKNGKATELNVPGQSGVSHRDTRDDRVPPGRNRRSVWTVATQSFSGAHFAVFPPKLIEPMVLASTSERGGCPQPGCGKPWVRAVERVKGEPDSYNGSSFSKGKAKEAREHLAAVGEQERTAATITTGWLPTCAHGGLSPIPAVILDPFMGSGTTGEVALRYRRNFVGFELNETYVNELAPDRLNGTQVKLFD